MNTTIYLSDRKPQSYFDMIRLMSQAKMVLTDSGGIQEETTILGVPYLIIRKTSELDWKSLKKMTSNSKGCP